METERSPTRSEWVALAGTVLAAVGTVPPWIVVAPGQDVVIRIYVPGMEWGLAGVDYLVLGVLAVGTAAAARTRPARSEAVVAAGTGIVVAALAAQFLWARVLFGPAALGAFMPGPGVGLTLVGATLLVAAGWWHVRWVAADAGAAAPAGFPG